MTLLVAFNVDDNRRELATFSYPDSNSALKDVPELILDLEISNIEFRCYEKTKFSQYPLLWVLCSREATDNDDCYVIEN